MEVQSVLHMVGGEGKGSYAANSNLQRRIIVKLKSLLQDVVVQLYCKTLPRCLTIADMGCSSGPNSLFVVSEIIDVVERTRKMLGRPSPEFHVYLNDLPGNDFNTLFKSIPSFTTKLRENKGDEFGHCFVAGVPGTFYGRLFPAQSLSIVHSSSCLHWLSQVPRGIEDNNSNISISTDSPLVVLEAYADQFHKDFLSFLRARSIEMVDGGSMFIHLLGRRNLDPSDDVYDLLGKSLRDMFSQGLVEEEKLHTFNLPLYAQHVDEVRSIVQSEGSFSLTQWEIFDVEWCISETFTDKQRSGNFMASTIRAVTESMIINHFGESILDHLFCRFAELVGEYLAKERHHHTILGICLAKHDKHLK